MECSKRYDLPASALSPETDKRLARVFATLRQHDRKSRLQRKTAELDELRGAAKSSETTWQRATAVFPPVMVMSGADNGRGEEGEAATTGIAATEQSQRDATALLELEIQELHRQINPKDFDTSGQITPADLSSAFRSLHRPTAKNDIHWLIWEVDDDMDGSIDWDEFRGAFVRTLVDRQGAEPNQLFYLILFLLAEPDQNAAVSVADLQTELERIPNTGHLIKRLLETLRVPADQLEQRRFTLAAYLDAVLAHLPPSFSGPHFQPNAK